MITIETIIYAQAIKFIDYFPVSIQADLKDILDHLNANFEQLSAKPEIGVIHGDVNCDVFELPSSFDIVLVLGNVTVKSFVQDTGPSDYSLLAISYDVIADAVISLCSMVVGGNIQARCVYGNSLNDGQLVVAGNISAAQLFLETGQLTQCTGRLQAPLIISTHNEIHAADGIQGLYFNHTEDDFLHYFLDELIESKPEIIFNGSVWTETGKIHRYIDTDALLTTLQASNPVLRPA
jgi:hypothetical protein